MDEKLYKFITDYKLKYRKSHSFKVKNTGEIESRPLMRIYNLRRKTIYKLVELFFQDEVLDLFFDFIITYYTIEKCILVAIRQNYVKFSIDDSKDYKYNTISCNSIEWKNGTITRTFYNYLPFDENKFESLVPSSLKEYIDKTYIVIRNDGQHYFKIKENSFPETDNLLEIIQNCDEYKELFSNAKNLSLNLLQVCNSSQTIYFRLS